MGVDELLDLPLAWERVKRDIKSGRVFVHHPHEQAIIEENSPTWIGRIKSDIGEGRYSPSGLYIANIPKINGAIRPGGYLILRDQVVYTAIVGSMISRIRDALSWGTRIIDFSYPIAEDLSKADWLKSSFRLWRDFDIASISRIDEGYGHVLMADIAGYYELVDFEILISDLRNIGIEDSLCKQLSACLNRWSVSSTPGRGLPQGFSASDILGRLYLNTVDRALNERGVPHYRYVDDYRLFAKTEGEALQSFVELISLLRKRGLVIQSEKSRIYNGVEAREKILGIQPKLQAILNKFNEEIETLLAISSPYLTSWEIQRLIEDDPNQTPIEVIRTAYRKYFIEGMEEFNKILFHFLLNKLVISKDRYAFPQVIDVLVQHPEETLPVLKYISNIASIAEIDPYILKLMQSARSVYPYQIYLFIQWRCAQSFRPNEEFIAHIRKIAFREQLPPFVVSFCREFLAKWGSTVDLDRLQESLQTASSELEKAELICCLRRMESGRRNSLLSRLATEGDFPARAARLVRAGRIL